MLPLFLIFATHTEEIPKSVKKRIASWFQVYYQPRQKIRVVLRDRPGNRIYLFMCLAGFVVLFQFFDLINAGDGQSIGTIISRSLILGPISSVVVSSLFIAGVYVSARLLKGRTRYANITAAVGRGMFPYFFAFFLWMIHFVWLDGACFLSESEVSFLGTLVSVLIYACLIAVPVYTVIFLSEATHSKLVFAGLMYVLGIVIGAVIGALIYLALTLLANLVIFLNVDKYSFFFPMLS